MERDRYLLQLATSYREQNSLLQKMRGYGISIALAIHSVGCYCKSNSAGAKCIITEVSKRMRKA